MSADARGPYKTVSPGWYPLANGGAIFVREDATADIYGPDGTLAGSLVHPEITPEIISYGRRLVEVLGLSDEKGSSDS